MLHHHLLIIYEILSTSLLFHLSSVAISYATIRCVPWSILIALICRDACLLICVWSLPLFWWISFSSFSLLYICGEWLLHWFEIGISFVYLISSSISASMWITFICIIDWSLTHLRLLHLYLFLNLLNLVYLMLAFIFDLSIWLFWLIPHRRLAILLILTRI